MRTRFAPSPTGYMHLGNLRTALFGYLLARNMGGTFVLRIEDTDQGRYIEGALDAIYNTLKIVGITYDEGPDKPGNYGPYVQSERKANYMDYAKQLIEKGAAYYCFCDKERLEGMEGYDRKCVHLSKEEIDKNLAAGMSFVVRQLIPEGKTTFSDLVFGDITVDNSEMEDQVLIKSDGMPTYNFANVVDDHLMAITHVIRGSEYLPSTPKYNLLYEALGWEIPAYVHMPLILSAGGGKLSKRHGDAYFEDFINKGFLPEAIINYIALLGWSPPALELELGLDNREIYSISELTEIFGIEGISKSPAIFDINKLKWVNGEYLKTMDFEAFYQIAEEYIAGSVKNTCTDKRQLAKMVQGRISVLSEIPEILDFIDTLPEYSLELYTHKKSKCDADIAESVLAKLASVLMEYNEDNWQNDKLYEFLTNFAQSEGLKNSQVLWPVRTAVSGKEATPGGASDLLFILGKDESVSRITFALQKLKER